MLNTGKIICGLDLGSNRIKAAVGILNRKGNFSCLEYANVKSYGMSAGFITDISRLTRILKQLMRMLEKKINRKIKRIYVNINGKDLIFREASAVMPLCDRGNKIVRLSDINSVKSCARSLNIKLEEEIIHDFSYRYTLDDHNQVQNPRGLCGHKLATDLYLIIAKISHIENIVKLLNQAGLEAEEIVFSGLASGLAALDKKQREKGSILIDIGADLTQLAIFKDGILCLADIIFYGGNNITASIAKVLKFPFGLAEEIKDSYGSVSSCDINENEEVMIKKDNSYQPIKRRAISSIIESEVTQLFIRLKEKIDTRPYLKHTDYSVTVIGGSSLLDGLLELAESILGVSVKLGVPYDLSFLSNRAVSYMTSIGLIRYGFNSAKDNRFAIFKSRDTNLLTHLAARLKDIYSEYF